MIIIIMIIIIIIIIIIITIIIIIIMKMKIIIIAGNHQNLVFTDQSDGELVRKTKETCEDFSKFYLPS